MVFKFAQPVQSIEKLALVEHLAGNVWYGKNVWISPEETLFDDLDFTNRSVNLIHHMQSYSSTD